EREANQEAAITCYQEALRVRTYARLPLDYAMTQNNLGIVYQERLVGEKEANQEAALTCYTEALRVYTYARLPREHRETQLNLAFACMEWGLWEPAHAAYQGALKAEELLLAQVSGGLRSSDIILREGRGAATCDGFALTRLDRRAEAALAIERGRARGLAESRRRATGDPARIGEPDRRRRYQQALAAFNAAQKTSNTPISDDDLIAVGGLNPATLPAERQARAAAIEAAQRAVELARSMKLSAAREAFDRLVNEIRAADDPADFLLAPLDEATLWRAASVGEPGHALVYLAATPWGGIAVAALTANPRLKTERRCLTRGLPALTETLVNDLIERMIPADQPDKDGVIRNRLVAGFAWAQMGHGFGRFLYDWPGATFREKAAALHRGCEAAGIAPEQATLDTAAQATLATLGTSPRLAAMLDMPLSVLLTADPLNLLARLVGAFDGAFLRAELTYSRATLAGAALRPLAAWLNEQGATSVTLIPGGGLGTFPLLAVPVAPAGPHETSARVFADAFPKGASVAPSAHALLRDWRDQEAAQVKRNRSGVIALGNPDPDHAPLEWGEAEAITLARLARKVGLPAESHTRTNARRGWLLHALRTAWVADLSCHGMFDFDSPLDSALLLALKKTLTLRELLSLGLGEGEEGGEPAQTDLRGLRLLILSACQTAILDLRGAQEEARSLAAGILEAGAEAAMAAQWSVSDKATYLLMVKFAQLWLPNRETMAPAAALLLAQRWLRNVTNAELRKWRYDTLAPITAEERTAASGEAEGSDPWESEAQQQAAYTSAHAEAEGVLAEHLTAHGQTKGEAPENLVVQRLRGLRLRRTHDLADDGRDAAPGAERGDRFGVKEAEEQIQVAAANDRDDACPFADPFYWAGFQITGW
ncbi:MAG: CHAT domain-containing protein, partial [Ktedonobacterales bacterium]